MRAVVAAATDIGHVREGNEDSYLVEDPLFAVADGMGGHRGGEVASSLALETIEAAFARGAGTLAEQVQEANRTVFERSLRDRAVAGMGTTLTAAMLEGDRLRLAHVGDSRAYLLRDGRLRRLTEDHTLVHRMVQEGEISEAEAETHPHRNILIRVLGTEPIVDVDESALDLAEGDRLLLCTDGLTGMVAESRVAEILAEATDPRSVADALVREANEAGGVDNITAIVIDIVPGDPPPAPVRTTTETMPAMAAEPAPSAAVEPAAPAAEPAPARQRRWSGRARRPVLSTLVVLAVLAIVSVGFRVYLDTQWYVGVSDDRVAIYQGVPATVAGFDLYRVVVQTDIPAATATSLAVYRDLPDGITAADRADADAIVEQIRSDVVQASRATPSPAAPSGVT